METVVIDGQDFAAGEIPGANLEEILLNILEHPSTSGRVISGVLLNGEPYSEEVPHAALEVERSTIKSLELDTLTIEDMGLAFLKQGPAYANALLEVLPGITESFRLGDEQEANEYFLNFLESLQLLMSMLEQSRQVLNLWQGRDEENSSRLSSFLDSLISLQEQKDWIFLADVLEYELSDALKELGELLPLLSQGGH